MCVFSYSDSKYANQLQHIGSMKMDNQGVRLSDFAKSDGHSTDQLRSMITRNDVPFIPDVEEGKRRIYDGVDALAMALTVMLVQIQGMTWNKAALDVCVSRAALEFMNKKERGEEAKALWYVKSPTQKNVFRAFPHILPT